MEFTNHQIRRILRRYAEHYNGDDSRHVIDILHKKLSCTKQRICGNISWAIVGQKKVKTITHVAGKQSDLLKA